MKGFYGELKSTEMSMPVKRFFGLLITCNSEVKMVNKGDIFKDLPVLLPSFFLLDYTRQIFVCSCPLDYEYSSSRLVLPARS